MTATTRREECIAEDAVYVACELGARTWHLAIGTCTGERVRHYVVPAGDLGAVQEKVARARTQWGLPAASPVVSCYEAGRDGFWLHRALTALGWRNLVLDATSIEHDRRAKPVKTDRVDAGRLLELLRRWVEGRQRLRVVRVPSIEEEDGRQRDRELLTVQAARVAVRNRITSLLVAQGIRARAEAVDAARLATVRTGDGHGLPPRLQERLEREAAALAALTARLATIRAARHAEVRAGATPAAQQTRALMRFKGLAEQSGARFVGEFFAWRRFRNGREVGALAGLTPTPYQSGQMVREQGISKAGNWRVRTLAIEIAWGWVRFQPQSALTRWYQARFGSGSPRLRRIGIVALARKLLIAWWRYLDAGVIPEGAVFKARG